MSDKRAEMQKYVDETVKHIENIKAQSNKISQLIAEDEVKKQRIEESIKLLKVELNQIDENLCRNYDLRNCFNDTICKAEANFKKIIESCQTLAAYLLNETESIESLSTHNTSTCNQSTEMSSH